MGPKLVVLPGGPGMARVDNLIRGMVNIPLDQSHFGQVMVELMKAPNNPSIIADLLQPFLRQFRLEKEEMPEFDMQIMHEAIKYGAQYFTAVWTNQLPDLSILNYRFSRWVGSDLVLERV